MQAGRREVIFIARAIPAAAFAANIDKSYSIYFGIELLFVELNFRAKKFEVPMM